MKKLIILSAFIVLFSSNFFSQSKEGLSLKRLNAAKTEFYDKEITVSGNLKIDKYYNWGYDDSENTHYSFELKDENYNYVHVYFKKNISKELFDKLIDVDFLPIKIKAIAYQSKQEQNFGSVLLEGISYEIIK